MFSQIRPLRFQIQCCLLADQDHYRTLSDTGSRVRYAPAPLLVAPPARRFQHPVPHPAHCRHRTIALPAPRVHHRYLPDLPSLMPQQWTLSAACARTPIMLSLTSRIRSLTFLSRWSDLFFLICRKMRKPNPAPPLFKRTLPGSQASLRNNSRPSLKGYSTTTAIERLH
jgi:hypothetical protein